MENLTLNMALMQFQNEIGIIKKDAKNPHFKNTYASLEQILSEVKPILTQCNLILLQPITDKGVCTQIFLNGGSETDFVESYIPLPVGLAPQPLGSAITYYRRYTLSSLLALEIDDDDAQSVVTPKIEVKQIVTTSLVDQVESAKAKIITATTLKDLETKYKALSPIEQRFNEVVELANKLKLTLK